MRIVRVLMVLSGWLILLVVAIITMHPIMALFVDNSIHGVPSELALQSVIAVVILGFPIFYGASFAIAPLVYATMGLFDNDG